MKKLILVLAGAMLAGSLLGQVETGRKTFTGPVELLGPVTIGDTVTLPANSIASAALPATIAGSTLISNATLKVYGQKLEIVAGGTVALPSATITGPMIGSTNMLVAVSNLFACVSINGTNFYMKTYP